MNTVAQQTVPNFESVWASIQELVQSQKETDRQMKALRS
jgi:hypothetical protein